MISFAEQTVLLEIAQMVHIGREDIARFPALDLTCNRGKNILECDIVDRHAEERHRRLTPSRTAGR